MNDNVFETVVGAVVLVVAAVFAVYAVSSTDVGSVEGYELNARFERVDGLAPGADVRVSGIKVGSVIEQRLDPATYQAIVRMSIDPAVRLPVDTSAGVVSDGLLGGKYMSLSPGGEEAMLESGGEIRYTQASISLEQLIGKFVFGGADSSAP
ncbi:MAG: outer membrane lipid asymmetry maintenance protein MlaD [Alphaproteobacteria bacterium]|nr:outer membrane lipid asymmetry maintenance protein MlaD [Alphaproteobacteria bacterium]